MAIVISRDGECISMPTLDEDTRKKLRLAVAQAFLGLHPETITEAVASYQREHGMG